MTSFVDHVVVVVAVIAAMVVAFGAVSFVSLVVVANPRW